MHVNSTRGSDILSKSPKLLEPGPGLLLARKAPDKCAKCKMVPIEGHFIHEFLFTFRHLNYTVDLFLFFLSLILERDCVVNIDDGSSQVAEEGGVGGVNGEFLDGVREVAVFEVLSDEEIGFCRDGGLCGVQVREEVDLLGELLVFVGLDEQAFEVIDLIVGELLVGEIKAEAIFPVLDKKAICQKVLVTEIPALAGFTTKNERGAGADIGAGGSSDICAGVTGELGVDEG